MILDLDYAGFLIQVEVTYKGYPGSRYEPAEPPEFDLVYAQRHNGTEVVRRMRDLARDIGCSEESLYARLDPVLQRKMTERTDEGRRYAWEG